MKYVLFNGAGIVINILGVLLAIYGVAVDTNDYFTFTGIMLFLFGFVFHFHWFAPIKHLFAVLCYVVWIFAIAKWDRELGLAPATWILVMGIIIHWKAWFIIIASFWAGATIARLPRS